MKKSFLLIFLIAFTACIILIPMFLATISKNEKKQGVSISVSPTSPVMTPTVTGVTSMPNEEFPPLYTGVLWEKPNTGGNYTPNTSEIKKLGQDVTHYYYAIAENVSQKDASSLLGYYEKWFMDRTWTEDIVAGGLGNGTEGFLKSGKRFLISTEATSRSASTFRVIVEHN